jgi:rhodanese-related sulfurtransferase
MPVPRITKEDLQAQLESDAATKPILLDARLKYPYEHSSVTLPGAVRLDPAGGRPELARDTPIVVYDSDPDELVSARVAAELIKQGYRATALRGGIGDWLAGKLPTDEKHAPQQAPPKAGGPKT